MLEVFRTILFYVASFHKLCEDLFYVNVNKKKNRLPLRKFTVERFRFISSFISKKNLNDYIYTHVYFTSAWPGVTW